MDPYFLAIIALIIFSIIFVLYIRISAKVSKNSPPEPKPEAGDDDSARYDRANADPLASLKSDDFTLLE